MQVFLAVSRSQMGIDTSTHVQRLLFDAAGRI
jgi:hypothetical protein